MTTTAPDDPNAQATDPAREALEARLADLNAELRRATQRPIRGRRRVAPRAINAIERDVAAVLEALGERRRA